jgi:Protein of unknown function (DUF3761)
MDRIEAFGWTRRARGGACGVAVLAIFVLVGCGSASSGPTRTRSDASGGSPAPGAGHVALHLNAGSYSLPAARTIISGKVTRGAAVRVNGRLVHVRAGRWARTLTLHLVCTNGTYVNSAGNTVCSPEQSSTVPEGATAECEDGTYSFSESRSGTCSSHGGVAKWL